MQAQVVFGGAVELFVQGGVHGAQLLVVEPAHQFADVLHLAPFALEIGDALGLGHGIYQFLGQVQAGHQVGAQGKQVFAELLQLGAGAFQIGTGGITGALEFALELQVQLTAFGNELTAHKVAFFGFA